MLGVGLGLNRPGRAASGFSPADIAGLTGWWDASDTGSITESGGAISQWDDKSGNGYHLVQASSALQPATGTRTLNGLNTVEFVPTDYVRASAFTVTQPNTVFHVSVLDARSTNFLWDGSVDRQIYYVASSAERYFAGNNVVAPGPSPATGVASLVSIVFNGASSFMRRDGSEVVSGDSGPNDLTDLYVGSTNSGSDGWDGTLGEMIVYSGALSAGDIATVESYLAAKWGVTLP